MYFKYRLLENKLYICTLILRCLGKLSPIYRNILGIEPPDSHCMVFSSNSHRTEQLYEQLVRTAKHISIRRSLPASATVSLSPESFLVYVFWFFSPSSSSSSSQWVTLFAVSRSAYSYEHHRLHRCGSPSAIQGSVSRI